MANWLYTIHIGDLHEKFRKGHISPAQLGERVAARLRASLVYSRYDMELEELAADFEAIADIEEYDCALEGLYNWGDESHRLWVNTFDVGKAPD